jgi:outer membrane receptor protein involved in Fe transport
VATLYKGTALELFLVQRQLMRGVFTLDGGFKLFGNDWTWKAYAQSSAMRQVERVPYNTIAQNYSNAVNAVTVTAAGPNSLGGGDPVLAAQVKAALTAAGASVPQVGQTACASSLTSTSWGTTVNPNGSTGVLPGGLTPFCAPLNLFGTGGASEAALNYIAPGRIDPAKMDIGFWYMGQSVMDISTQGVLPWGLPAGNIAVATGYTYRLEQETQKRDPLQLGSSGVYTSGNFGQYQGHYDVHEGFLEVNAPLLKDNFVQSLDFNAAGRITGYSTSGVVETWKLGLTSQVNEDIRFRGTVSGDIRAPSVAELFSTTSFAVSQFSYPPPNGPSTQVHIVNGGNPNLSPELSQTWTGGVVLTPHWIPNLTLSFDWYNISIHKAIFQVSNQQIAAQCAAGNSIYCSNIFFAKGFPGNTNIPVAQEIDGNGKPASGFFASVGTFAADCEGCYNLVFVSPLNASGETTSGLDFQADYSMDLWDKDTLSWRWVGNYTDQNTITQLGQTFNGAGIFQGANFTNPLAGQTQPKLNFKLSATYDTGPYELTVQGRYIGSARITPNLVDGVGIDKNEIDPTAYLDLRGSYQWTDKIQAYFAVDNTLNTPPQRAGGQAVYDYLGRSFRVGVRFSD